MRLDRPKRPGRPITSCVINAPAKLNLCLELLGKRPDGFHELRTVMSTVRLFDTIRVDAAIDQTAIELELGGGSLDSGGVPTDRSNLVVRALESLRREAGIDAGARVRLAKRIPSQAGLGGGSSDAAAALLAGNQVWGIDWPVDRLATIAAQLGSDIPFFVHVLGTPDTPAALASGRGEAIDLVPARLRHQPVVIVKPEAGLSTAAVFGQCRPEDFEQHKTNRCGEVVAALAAGDFQALGRSMTNGLRAAAQRMAPWLSQIAACFRTAGCCFHQLSGSGSAYFGLTRTPREASRLAARLRALRVGQVYTTRFA